MSLLPGHMLAHYRLVEKIGEGGMGVVYLAEDTKLDRRIALKILPSKFTDSAERRARFEREAKAVAALNHPSIVTVHSVEQADGVHFITMELVEGQPLSRNIPKGGVGLDRFFQVALPLVDAISAAHDGGITHRDLKPDNIMAGSDGRVRVLDFGLAKLQEREDSMHRGSELPTETAEGCIFGTAAYMSPEQAQGKPVDHRTDIFSLGIILYELVTGKRPFRGDNSISMISSIIKDLPPPVHHLEPRLPNHLGRIIRRCLEKDPERRYQRARDLHHELEDLRSEIQADKIRAEPGSPAPPRSRPWLVPAILLLSAVVLVFAGWAFLPGILPAGGEAILDASLPTENVSVGVLPFVNMSPDKENEYFADGMTEELINSLVKVRSLKVPSRTSVFTYKGKNLLAEEIGRQLGVTHILEGSVRRAGDRLRVTAQLISVEDGFHLWSETYDSEMADVFSIQEEIAQGIVDNLKIHLMDSEPSELVEKATESLDAYDLYLQGRFQLNRHTEQSLRESIARYKQAIAADPEYALAYVGLADAWFELSSWYRPPREVMPRSKEAALKALELDESLANAHATLGMVLLVYDWDWDGAKKQFLRAIELDPQNAAARVGYGAVLAATSRFDQALAEARRAHELEPRIHSVNYMVLLTLYMAREYEECVEMSLGILKVDPEAHLVHAVLALTYERLGRHREAIAASREATRLDDSPFLKTILIFALASSGERIAAETLLEELMETTEARYVCPYEIALDYYALDDTEMMFDWLERAYDARGDCWVWGNVDPRLDEMRKNSRYQDLLRRVGHSVEAGG